MTPLVDCVIEDPRWEEVDLEALAERASRAVLGHLGLEQERFEISLLGADDARVRELNRQFRGKADPTNVLSWPAAERAAEREGAHPARPEPGAAGSPEVLGDIALAYDTCAREAEAGGKLLSEHAAHLVVHGVLHLLGYDHARDGDASLMESIEVAVLASLGVADPYGNSGEQGPG